MDRKRGLYVVLKINPDGTYSDKLSEVGFKKGESLSRGDYSTDVIGNPKVIQIQNPDGSFTTTIDLPNRFEFVSTRELNPSGYIKYVATKGQVTITTLNRMNGLTLIGTRTFGRPIQGAIDLIGWRSINPLKDLFKFL